MIKPTKPKTENDFDAALKEARAHHQAGRFSQAEQIYKQILERRSDDATVLSKLGAALASQGKLDEASTVLQRAVEIDPELVDAHNNLGAAFQIQGKLNDAVAACGRALAIDPDHVSAHVNLGTALQELGRPEDAVASYQKALAIEPGSADAHINLGNALQKLERLEDAVASYQKALDIKPDLVGAHVNLGTTLRHLGRLEEAVASCQKALAIEPGSADAHVTLGTALRHLGRQADAEKSYSRALEIDPDLDGARYLRSAITGETMETAPKDYVRKLFDNHARRFDDHLVNNLHYRVPELMRQAVNRLTDDKGKFKRALDLGCGTGMVGQEFRDIVEQLHGIDLSPGMAEKAKQKDIYDEIFLEDVREFLENTENQRKAYDIVLAADLFIYIGNLAPIFAAVGKILPEKGMFVFSIEHLEHGTYQINKNGRYSQSNAYINDLASEYGFSVVLSDPVDIRKEPTGTAAGTLFVLQAGPRA